MDKKAKILFILHLPPPVHGAAMVGQLIKESQHINKAIDADYINLSTSTELNDIGKGGIRKVGTLLQIQLQVFRFLMKKKYALCYITLTAKGIGFYKDLFIVIILKLFRKKIVYHFHNKGVKANSNSTINNLMYKFAFSGSKSILLSPHLYFDISKYVQKGDVYFCPNGIEHVTYSTSATEESRINPKKCKFLFLSNMMREKGVVLLLEACKELQKKGLNFEIDFIGPWSDITEEKFHDLVQRFKIGSKVFAHGKKYGKDKIAFFKEADAFIFPTYYHNECFPLVLLEAMQASLPVLSTFEGGIPSIVTDGETGILIPRSDLKKLTEKLEFLINNPVIRKQMGEAGKKKFDTDFTIANFEKSMLDILKDASFSQIR